MVIGDIGETAGEIWTLLNQNGDMTMSGVASNVDRPKALVEMGLGWLAREEKISISKEKRGIRISLK
ncbi:MAG: winged helix-turn-helix domain-containing protein [Halobacteriota archaeon]|nr:winged helix-turn-helix domain-containing protein [Halobacteriota archaeon]